MLLSFTDKDCLNTALVGGKGYGLAKATAAGLPVPPGVVLTTEAYRRWFAPHRDRVLALLKQHISDEEKSRAVSAYLALQPLPVALQQQISAWHRHRQTDYFAVRSSGSAEDMPGAAFAGLHDTLLNVRGEAALLDAVKSCWLSLWNTHVLPYRERLGIAHDDATMAVVIQQMVEVSAQEAAGVAFSLDPVGEDIRQVLINAAFGLGESVVGGEAPVDEYRVDHEGRISSQYIAAKTHALTRDGSISLPKQQQNQPAINAQQAAEIAALARQAEAHFGFPQDIEWAYANGNLALLQSRPITRFPARWTRDEAAERFPNPVTPLTWALCEAGFHESLNYSFRLMGLPPFYDKWFTRKDGYIYGNQNAVAVYAGRLPLAPLANIENLRQFIRTGGLWQFAWISELPTEWMNNLDSYLLQLGAFNAIDYHGKSLTECRAILQEINALGTRYFLPNIAISLTQTLLYRILRHVLLQQFDPEQAQEIFDRLIAVTDTKTGAVNNAMWQLSRRLREHPNLMQRRFHQAASLRDALTQAPAFAAAFSDFLAVHGHREVDFDAYQPTWLEAPQTVFTQIQMMAAQEDSERERHRWQQKDCMYSTERELLNSTPVDLRFFLQELIRLVRTYTALDDIEHYQTTRLTIPFRRAARAIGERLVAQGALDSAMDVFFLTPKILDHAIATGDYTTLTATARDNKAAYQHAQQHPPAWVYGEHHHATDNSNCWQGLGGSSGIVEGEVFVITDPNCFADFPQGAILVARTTNPAWTPLFYHACGVITESGGPLSHGAVTARELGIPAVMGIRDACRLLPNGSRVRLDGQRGTVRKLD